MNTPFSILRIKRNKFYGPFWRHSRKKKLFWKNKSYTEISYVSLSHPVWNKRNYWITQDCLLGLICSLILANSEIQFCIKQHHTRICTKSSNLCKKKKSNVRFKITWSQRHCKDGVSHLVQMRPYYLVQDVEQRQRRHQDGRAKLGVVG